MLPLQTSMKKKKWFNTTLTITVLFIMIFYVIFATTGYIGYDNNIQKLITDNLPKGIIKFAVQLLIASGLTVTYPIILYPVVESLEKLFYKYIILPKRKYPISKDTESTITDTTEHEYYQNGFNRDIDDVVSASGSKYNEDSMSESTEEENSLLLENSSNTVKYNTIDDVRITLSNKNPKYTSNLAKFVSMDVAKKDVSSLRNDVNSDMEIIVENISSAKISQIYGYASPKLPFHKSLIMFIFRAIVRTGLVFLTYLAAIKIPYFNLFIGLVGALFAASLQYTFPALLDIKILWLKFSKINKFSSKLLSLVLMIKDMCIVVFGLFITISGSITTINSLYNAIKADALN